MAAVARGQVLPGIDPGAVTRWLRARLGVEAPVRYDLVAAGRSNLTYRVRDARGRQLALRRPPVHHVLPTAHDVAREHRILTALWPTPVPVPEPLALCEDPTVTGAPFSVMAFVEGPVVRDADGAAAALRGVAARARAGTALADTLAALHAVDVDAAGLGGLARRGGYVARQVRRWSAQCAAAGGDVARELGALGAALAARVPPEQGPVLVHGDFRLDNAVVRADGRVAAVLDWELSTLGDPMADLGTFLDYWGLPEDGEPILERSPATTLPGFPSREELLARYAAASGRDVSDIAYFRAFGYWRLACILFGVHARYAGGAPAGDPERTDDLPRTVSRLATLATTTLGAQ